MRTKKTEVQHDLKWCERVTRENPLLFREEEIELGQQIEQGNEKAREKLFLSNIRLVLSVARACIRKFPVLEFSDLVSEGMTGLSRAVDGYDWRRGVKFSTYATWWIRQAMGRYALNNHKALRIPAYVEELKRRLFLIEKKLRLELDRDPTPEEVEARSKMSKKHLAYVKRARAVDHLYNGEHLEKTAAQSHQPHLIEVNDSQTRLRTVVRSILEDFDERDRRLIVLRFGLDGDEPMTLKEVGKAVGVTRERVRQIERNVLAELALYPSLSRLAFVDNRH